MPGGSKEERSSQSLMYVKLLIMSRFNIDLSVMNRFSEVFRPLVMRTYRHIGVRSTARAGFSPLMIEGQM